MSLEDRTARTTVVDVRISESLDALYLSPRDTAQGIDVVLALHHAFPKGTAFRRSADGVRVPIGASAALVVPPVGLDLRWSTEALRFVENRRQAASVLNHVRYTVEQIKTGGASYAIELVRDSAGLGTLDPHQIVNVAAMTVPGSFGLCVFDEQGAGKTVTFIYAFDLLAARDEADVALIVAPKSMVPEWPRDFQQFRGDLYRVAVLTGTREEKWRALESGADVFVTNFETSVALEPELKALLRAKQGRAVLAVDESFFIKSLDTKRTRALRRLREWCGRAYVLCGTPAPNSAHDLVQQFSLVDFGMTFEGVTIPDDRTEAARPIQEAIEAKGLYVRHLKEDVLPNLPQKRFQRVYVPFAPVQRRAYQAALRDLTLDVEAVAEEEFRRRITSFLARRSALLQICSHPGSIIPRYNEIPAKLQALDKLLHELVELDREKVVVWSFFTASITAIADRYARYGVVRYDGTIADTAARRDAVRRFQEDDSTMVFLGNPAAAGAGLTLHRPRVAIYESLSNQAAHYLQSVDRIHRRGQTRDVDYIVLLCEHSIEIAEYERLVDKESAAQALLGDRVARPLTRETFLADARAAAELLTVVRR